MENMLSIILETISYKLKLYNNKSEQYYISFNVNIEKTDLKIC